MCATESLIHVHLTEYTKCNLVKEFDWHCIELIKKFTAQGCFRALFLASNWRRAGSVFSIHNFSVSFTFEILAFPVPSPIEAYTTHTQSFHNLKTGCEGISTEKKGDIRILFRRGNSVHSAFIMQVHSGWAERKQYKVYVLGTLAMRSWVLGPLAMRSRVAF